MRLKAIVCKVLQREAYYCAARSVNEVDVHVMPQGLHNEPDRLRDEVQKALEQVSDVRGRPYDALLLGYGLCSNGITGLCASIPIVVPRGHDCVTLLLGSRERYGEYFDSHRGIYWYSPGWIESDVQPGKERHERTLQEYIDKYGQDNAEYLMEVEQGWMTEYSWATYVDWECLGDGEKYKQFTRRCARYLGWTYDDVKGDPGLMQRLLDGDWRPGEVLVVEPGKKIAEDLTGPGIIKAE